jgi:hypothetical protein
MDFQMDGPTITALSAFVGGVIAAIIRELKKNKKDVQKHAETIKAIKDLEHTVEVVGKEVVSKVESHAEAGRKIVMREIEAKDNYWRDRMDNEDRNNERIEKNVESKLAEMSRSLIELIKQI